MIKLQGLLFNKFIFSLLIFPSAENDVIAIFCDKRLLNTWQSTEQRVIDTSVDNRRVVNARLEHLFLAFENNCVKLNTDRPHTVAAIMYLRDSSFWQYKVYAGIRRGSLERRHQTTAGSRVMRTCCRRMLKCIRCVHTA